METENTIITRDTQLKLHDKTITIAKTVIELEHNLIHKKGMDKNWQLERLKRIHEQIDKVYDLLFQK